MTKKIVTSLLLFTFIKVELNAQPWTADNG